MFAADRLTCVVPAAQGTIIRRRKRGVGSFDYVDWYTGRPVWVQAVLAPVAVPIMLVHAMVGMVFLCVLFPFLAVKCEWENRRRWRRLRRQGRVARWVDVEPLKI